MVDLSEKEQINMVESVDIDNVDPHASAEISMWQSARQNPKVIIYALLMTFGPMAFGFDVIAVGVVTAIPSFLITFGEPFGPTYILPSIWLALWNALIQVGFMIGAIISAPVADRLGRRTAMAIGSIVTMLAIAIIYIADVSSNIDTRRGTFLAGKTVLGVGLSMMMSVCQTYNSEIVPTKLRGPILSIFQFSLVLGQLVAAVVAGSQTSAGFSQKAYRVCFATQWIFAGLAFIAAFIIPESPVHLLRKGNISGASKSFARLHSADTVDASIVAMKSLLEHEKQLDVLNKGTTYRSCFTGNNWRRTRIIIYASIVQQFLGISFVANGTYFMIVAGLAPANVIMVLEIVLGLALVANIISWFLATTVGRRRTLIGCCVWLCLVWLSVGIAGCFSSTAALWYMGIMINLILFFFGVGAGGIIPIVTSETSSVQLRAKSNAIGFAFSGFSSWLFNFVVPYIFNTDAGNLGGKTGFIFAGLCAVAAVVLFLELPEMKNRTYMQLDEMFEEGLKTRLFAKHETRSGPTVA